MKFSTRIPFTDDVIEVRVPVVANLLLFALYHHPIPLISYWSHVLWRVIILPLRW